MNRLSSCSVIVAVAVFGLAGCRFDYETGWQGSGVNLGGEGGGLAGGGDVGEVGGAPAGVGGSSGGESASGGVGGGVFSGDLLLVTTTQDEADAGATASEPGGSGLSLREALVLANTATQGVTISFGVSGPFLLDSPLPAFEGEIHLEGSLEVLNFAPYRGSEPCLELLAGTTTLNGLQILGCPGRVIEILGGSGHQITGTVLTNHAGAIRTGAQSSGSVIGPRNVIRNGNQNAVILDAPGDSVIDNTFVDVSASCVQLLSEAKEAQVIGNVLNRCTTSLEVDAGANNPKVWHNTFASASGAALSLGVAAGADLVNNIFAFNSVAIDGPSASFSRFSHNLYFANGLDCTDCATLGEEALSGDPLFEDAGQDDFTLKEGSVGIDSALDMELDRNALDPGLYFGAGPDRGALEAGGP